MMASSDADALSNEASRLSIRSSAPALTTSAALDPSLHDDPPPYSAHDPNAARLNPSQARDPRVSSAQSLVSPGPTLAASSARRTLLLIFIHGFMGDETSFQSFPAHLHNLLTTLVADTHSVHTKIYPRYLSRRPIQVANADFSAWLQPHESANTDVVLLGHSMGGLLAAEVALLPSPPDHASPFQHRLLGTMSFDTPFLGMHPGVIRSGLGSLFRADSGPPQSPPLAPGSPASAPAASAGGIPPPQSNDANYNPAFFNDVNLPVRTGWKNAQHFVRKHVKNLKSATQDLVTSRLEFGSCLADFEGLKVRYCKIRMLEDDDQNRRSTMVQDQRVPPRIRFANYYTASTGRPRRPPPQSAMPQEPSTPQEPAMPQDPPGFSEETPGPTYPDEKRSFSHQPDATNNLGDPQSLATELDEPAPSGSDIDSILSDLSDLDTLDDARSEFSVATTLASPVEVARSTTLIREDVAAEQKVSASTAPQPGVEQKRHLPLSPFVPHPTPQPGQFHTRAAFKIALKQQHDMIKSNMSVFKEQQKAEYARLKLQALQAPKAHREEVKAFIESQKEERKRFYEATKADWKSLFDTVVDEMEARKNSLPFKGDSKKSAEKMERQRRRVDKRMDHHLQRLDRKCQRTQSKLERKFNKIESGVKDTAESPEYDVSTAPISETINNVSVDDASSSISSSSGPLRTNTMQSASSAATSTRSKSLASPTSDYAPYASPSPSVELPPSSAKAAGPKPKMRKFCVLPPKDGSGIRDPAWIRVQMKDMDEVGAHCGLFFPLGPGEDIAPGAQWSERYAWLLHDTAERVESWVENAISERIW